MPTTQLTIKRNFLIKNPKSLALKKEVLWNKNY